jgi:hypothetical protein
MADFRRQFGWHRAAAVGLLAVYGFVAALGHGLHSVLPCADSGCATHAADSHAHCCCHHHHGDNSFAHDHRGSDEPGVKAPGHDASQCAICTLLAKFKTGQVSVGVAAISFALVGFERPASGGMLPADLVLSKTSRGPPSA